MATYLCSRGRHARFNYGASLASAILGISLDSHGIWFVVQYLRGCGFLPKKMIRKTVFILFLSTASWASCSNTNIGNGFTCIISTTAHGSGSSNGITAAIVTTGATLYVGVVS